MTVRLIIKDEVNIKFEHLPLDARKRLAATFKYEIPYARHQPAFKLGRWDGMVSLFGLGGNGYLQQLEKCFEVLAGLGIDIDELEDLRSPPGNRLESLSRKLQGYYSIRINDQWRIVFKWDTQPYDVQIMDYH